MTIIGRTAPTRLRPGAVYAERKPSLGRRPPLQPRSPMTAGGNPLSNGCLGDAAQRPALHGTEGTRSQRSVSAAAYAVGSFETPALPVVSAHAKLVGGPIEAGGAAPQHARRGTPRLRPTATARLLARARRRTARGCRQAADGPTQAGSSAPAPPPACRSHRVGAPLLHVRSSKPRWALASGPCRRTSAARRLGPASRRKRQSAI